MKKLILLLTVLMFACSTDQVNINESQQLKAKPVDELVECDLVPLPSFVDTDTTDWLLNGTVSNITMREAIFNRFNWLPNGYPNNVWGVSVNYATVATNGTVPIEANSIVFGYIPFWSNYFGNDYRNLEYRFRILEDGVIVGYGCISPGYWVSSYQWDAPKKNGKPADRTFTVEFYDYPEITHQFSFVVPKKGGGN
jgi:hypothetical protein